MKDLTVGLYGSGRNVTTDDFFTSYNLAQFLLTKQLTLLGTVRKNRKEVPPELMPSKRAEYESLFVFTKDTSMVSYGKIHKTNNVIVQRRFSNFKTGDKFKRLCNEYGFNIYDNLLSRSVYDNKFRLQFQ